MKAKRSRVAQPRGVVLQLVPQKISEDTVSLFGYMLDEARAGAIVGGICAVMRAGPGGNFTCHVGGECKREVTFTRGMVAGLADVMTEKMLTSR